MRVAGILCASSLVGLATAFSLHQKEKASQDVYAVVRSTTTDIHLFKRGGREIHDIVHYARKADKWQDERLLRLDTGVRGKEQGHRLKENALRLNDPHYTQEVVNNYQRRVDKAEKARESGHAVSNEKMQHWKDMMQVWEQRRIMLKEKMETAKQAGKIERWDKVALAKLRAYRTTEWLVRDKGRKANALLVPQYNKKIGSRWDDEKYIEQKYKEITPSKDGIEPSNHLQKRGVIHEDPMYYYKKADKYDIGSQKYLDHRLKAAGARFNNPLSSNDVVRRYTSKIKDAQAMLAKGEGDSKILTRKLDKWQTEAVPEWEARQDWLQSEKDRKLKDGTWWFKDPVIEEKYSEYVQSKKSHDDGTHSQDDATIRDQADASDEESRVDHSLL